MGWLNDLYRLMDDSTPAMEADDITTELNSQTTNVLGTDSDLAENNGEIDLDTNDILGTKRDNSSTTEDSMDNPGDGPDDSMDEEDKPPEDGDPTSSDNPSGIPDEPPAATTPEETLDEKEDPFSASRKRKLWKNFRTFYECLGDSAKLIAQYVPNTSDANTIRALDNIRDNLSEARDMVYDILTKQYQSMSYPDLQKKYVGLNHIYDLCIKELETYFDKYHDKS